MFKPFGHGYKPKSVSKNEIKNNLHRWAFHGESHIDNMWSETIKYIEELELRVNVMTEYFQSENAKYMEALKIAAERIEQLTNGPGGIMEMKQTIADKEAEIEQLEKYRNLVEFITSDYVELSYEKTQWQRDDWRKRCNKLIIEDHTK